MVRVSFRICAWTILLILCVGCADCLEVRKRPSIQGDHHPRRRSRRQDLETGSTTSLSAQLEMEVTTVNVTHAERSSAAERQNRRNKRSFSLEGSSSRPTTFMSLNNVTSVIGKSNSTKVTRNLNQTKKTFTLPIIVMNSSKSPFSENVTEFIKSLQRGSSLPRDNSTTVPPSTSSWPEVTLAQSIHSTVSTSSSISTYGRELNELFGIVQAGQRDSSAAIELLAGSPTERSISQDRHALDNRGNISSEERTLLNFIGPEILQDADSIVEQNSPEFTHLRVKRDKLLSKASYPLQEDLHFNSSHLHDLAYSFPTSSQSPYNDLPNEDRKSIDNYVHSIAPNPINSSMQPEYSLPALAPRLSVLSVSEIIKSEQGNSNSKNAQKVNKLRNALNDVYPNFVNDLKSPIRRVEFIRKKRQMLTSDNFLGNRSSYHEVLEDSYPEDDKVIESMLSKVDYNTLGRNSLARASPLQLQGNWAIGKSGKKRRTPPVNLVSRYNKKAMKNKHNAKNQTKRKEKCWKHSKVHSKEKRFLQGVPNRLIQDKSIIPNSLLGVINDYLQVESKIGKRNSSNSGFEMDAAKDNFKKNLRKRRADNIDDKKVIIFKVDQSIVSSHDDRGQKESLKEERDKGSLYPQHQSSESNFDQSEDEGRRVKRHEDDAGDTPKRRANDIQELQYYEDIREPDVLSRQNTLFAKRRRRSRVGRAAKSVEEIKELVEKLVAKVGELQNYVSNDGESKGSRKKVKSEKISGSNLEEEPRLLEHSTSMLDASNSSETRTNGKVEFQETQKHEELPNSVGRIDKDRTSLKGSTKIMAMAARRRGLRRARRKRKSHRKWDRWTDWSSCSVTCGKGRQIRWRHCIHDCTTAETEMEEKACQLPACAPGKFLGIF